MKSLSTWVVIFFVASTMLVAYVLGLAFADAFVFFRVQDTPILGPRFTTSTLAGTAVAGLVAVYTAFLNKRSRSFVEQFIVEFDKVAWPSWGETKTATITVIVTSIVAALVLGMFDAVFGWVTGLDLFLR